MEHQYKPVEKSMDEAASLKQSDALAGLVKLLSQRKFYGNVTIRFEAGYVVKVDQSASLRISDIEHLLAGKS